MRYIRIPGFSFRFYDQQLTDIDLHYVCSSSAAVLRSVALMYESVVICQPENYAVFLAVLQNKCLDIPVALTYRYLET